MKPDVVNLANWLSRKIFEGVTCITSKDGNVGSVTSSHFVGRDDVGKLTFMTSDKNKCIEFSNIVVKSQTDDHFIVFDITNKNFIMLCLTSKMVNLSNVKDDLDIHHLKSFSISSDNVIVKSCDVNGIKETLVYNCVDYVDIIEQNTWHHISKKDKSIKPKENISDIIKRFVEENDIKEKSPLKSSNQIEDDNNDIKIESININDKKIEKLVVDYDKDVKHIMSLYFKLHPEVHEIRFARWGNTLRVFQIIEEIEDRMYLSEI